MGTDKVRVSPFIAVAEISKIVKVEYTNALICTKDPGNSEVRKPGSPEARKLGCSEEPKGIDVDVSPDVSPL